VSKLNDVETVGTVETGEATRNGYEEMEAVTLDQHIGVRIPGGKQSFNYLRSKFAGPIHSGMPRPQGHLIGSSSPRNLRSGGT